MSVSLPEDASGPVYESDDFTQSRPEWTGDGWAARAVRYGANIIEFVQSGHLCNISDARDERNIFVGDWIGHPGVHSVLARQGAIDDGDPHVLFSVEFESKRLSEAQALQIVAGVQVDWDALASSKSGKGRRSGR